MIRSASAWYSRSAGRGAPPRPAANRDQIVIAEFGGDGVLTSEQPDRGLFVDALGQHRPPGDRHVALGGAMHRADLADAGLLGFVNHGPLLAGCLPGRLDAHDDEVGATPEVGHREVGSSCEHQLKWRAVQGDMK